MKSFFNKYEFNEAFKLQFTHPYEAKKRYEKYFLRYPKDYNSYPYYASLLILLGMFDEAEDILDYAENMAYKDENYRRNQKKMFFLNYGLVTGRLKILLFRGKYQEVIRYYDENKGIFIKKEEYSKDEEDKEEKECLESLIFYCRKKVGDLDLSKRNKNSYQWRQIVQYKEEDFRDHIKKHLLDELDEENPCIFKSGFPVDEVICEIKKYIPSNKCLYHGYYDNVYYFKYPEVGKCNNRMTNFFKVVALENSSDFITMCPVMEGENLPYIDLSYMIEKSDDKVKRISRVDAFYARYNRKVL